MSEGTTAKYLYIVCDRHDHPLIAAKYFYGIRPDGTLTRLVGPQGVAEGGGQYMLIDAQPRPQIAEPNRARFDRLYEQGRVRSRVVFLCPDSVCGSKLDLREEKLTPFLRTCAENGMPSVAFRGILRYAGDSG